MRVLVVILSLGAAACGPAVEGGPDSGDPSDGAGPDARRPDAPEVDYSRVYAHSGSTLYRLDTTTLDPVEVGAFGAALGAQSITDIAIDGDDNMVGISLDRIFTIDETTGTATFLAEIADGAPNLTSLSFVPVDLDDPGSEEILVAAADDGSVYEIDPGTGAATLLGSYGSTAQDLIRSSGDIVAVRGLGIYATVTIGDTLTDPDYLASIDPATWQATPLDVGLGHDKVFGVGFWRDTIYGFVDGGAGAGSIIAISPSDGSASVVDQGAIRWYGAGVTTDAPVVE